MLKNKIENDLITHWAEDSGKGYYIEQVETGALYSEAVDVIPCRYTYRATDIEVEENDNGIQD